MSTINNTISFLCICAALVGMLTDNSELLFINVIIATINCLIALRNG